MKIVLNTPNANKWHKHFVDMAEGKPLPQPLRGGGSYGPRRVASHYIPVKETESGVENAVQITPTQQNVMQARRALKRDRSPSVVIKGKKKRKSVSLQSGGGKTKTPTKRKPTGNKKGSKKTPYRDLYSSK